MIATLGKEIDQNPDFADPKNWFWCEDTHRWRPSYIYPGMRTPELPPELKNASGCKTYHCRLCAKCQEERVDK